MKSIPLEKAAAQAGNTQGWKTAAENQTGDIFHFITIWLCIALFPFFISPNPAIFTKLEHKFKKRIRFIYTQQGNILSCFNPFQRFQVNNPFKYIYIWLINIITQFCLLPEGSAQYAISKPLIHLLFDYRTGSVKCLHRGKMR